MSVLVKSWYFFYYYFAQINDLWQLSSLSTSSLRIIRVNAYNSLVDCFLYATNAQFQILFLIIFNKWITHVQIQKLYHILHTSASSHWLPWARHSFQWHLTGSLWRKLIITNIPIDINSVTIPSQTSLVIVIKECHFQFVFISDNQHHRHMRCSSWRTLVFTGEKTFKDVELCCF